MNAGYLSDFFEGVGAKRLTLVEIDPSASNQHEFQGVHRLKEIIGSPYDKVTFEALYVRLADDEDPERVESFATWSDVRRDNPNRSAEYHLYYSTLAGPLVRKCRPDDLLIVAINKNQSLTIFLVENGSTYEKQLLWLFGLNADFSKLDIRDIENGANRILDFAARSILEELGIDVETADDKWLDRILSRFGESFPSTSIFSSFSRETLTDVSPSADPDSALMAWIEQEEMLFRTLEKHIVAKRLEQNFENVEDFIKYSLSVQNRRKSRVGHALEHHLEQIFIENSIKYSRGQETEFKAKPDFIFPGITDYRNNEFPVECLDMLGVKSTCKDRWRQVLSEAARIDRKHLFTLEAGISENQTREMNAHQLTLVLPIQLHKTFSKSQQILILKLADYIAGLKEKQVLCI